MSEGMFADRDEITRADLEALAQLHVTERPRTETVVREVDDGTIVQGTERREVFTFEAPSEGTWVFDVRQIKDAIVDGRVPATMMRLAEVPQSFYEHVLSHNGVEEDRLARIDARAQERPGIMVFWGNEEGHTTLIDGNHRLCARYQRGEKSFRFLIVHVCDLADFMCRPGDEERLFGKRTDPRYEMLHVEILTEKIDDTSR